MSSAGVAPGVSSMTKFRACVIIGAGADFGFGLGCGAVVPDGVGALVCEDVVEAAGTVSEIAEALASGDSPAVVPSAGVPELDVSAFIVLVDGRASVRVVVGEDCGGGGSVTVTAGFGGGPVMRQPGGGV